MNDMNDDLSFLVYLKNKALKAAKDVSTRFYTLIFIGAFIYTAFDEGVEYALKYFFIAVVVMFLIYFYTMVILFIKYRNITRNSWILHFITLTVLAILAFFALTLKQIIYIASMSFVVVAICLSVPYLVDILTERTKK